GDDYPFTSYAFLSALEESGSASTETGWTPHHLIVRSENGKLIAAVPSYLKDHSYGEYVFDWAWADAYRRYGFTYYPKLLSAIPFTPSVGQRLLIDKEISSPKTIHHLIQLITHHCREQRLSSWHLLFPPEKFDPAALNGTELMHRSGTQYHWYNHGYQTFDDYLGGMKARKRNSIRKERQKVFDQGISFEHVTGGDLTTAQLRDFYTYYHATYLKRGQYGYLNIDFFELLAERMPNKMLIVFAKRGEKRIAAALFFLGSDTLYGRYWGCLDEYKHLHFETCYYQGIDYCIQNGLRHIDSGAQGEHKIQRGFEPIETHSYHWIARPEFRTAIEDFVEQEREHIHEYIEAAQSYLPFKKE
ncbi:MAG: GNAT family N-acetyltransferase, partial [Chloroflexota bacterium]